MKVAIVGAGAIGGLLGAHMTRSGQDVVLIARGPHLFAMQRRGLTVRSADGEFTVKPRCSDDIGAIAGADVVVLQQRLQALGYAVGTADGTFGPGTKAAVQQFQTAKKITPADGVVNQATWAALLATQ